jgi:16S rRNA (guanine966-N2)-methyltransferase
VRVIAGRFRSRPLHSLRGMDLRPTADRLRETLFNVLAAGNPTAFDGGVWLDLCAGTGAVGIEALSRGAAKVYFVESSAPAASLILRNLSSLGLADDSKASISLGFATPRFAVLREDVTRALRHLEGQGVSADFIFLDPPYRMEKIYRQTLHQVSQSRLLRPKAIVVAEHEKKFDPGDEFGPLQRYRKLKQGDAALSFYRIQKRPIAVSEDALWQPGGR